MKNLIMFLTVFMFLSGSAVSADEYGLLAEEKAPDFSATTHNGDTVLLSDVLQDGPVVLLFYRGGWCKYCNIQLQEYQQSISEFEDLDASIIAVSVDLQDNAATTVEEKELAFTVISDPQAHLLDMYNLAYTVPDETVTKYVDYGIDLTAASGRTDHMIAVPATYVIDQNGTIIFAYANVDYKVRPSAAEVLEALRVVSE